MASSNAAAIAFQIYAIDNVATLLTPSGPGPVIIRGADEAKPVKIYEQVALGHKIAIADIPKGEPVIKFGVTIGIASQDIVAGRWVHLHNCRSLFDERSDTLDLQTGLPKDINYE